MDTEVTHDALARDTPSPSRACFETDLFAKIENGVSRCTHNSAIAQITPATR
jgi:hypothetical protein